MGKRRLTLDESMALAFAAIERAAATGERCPENGTHGMSSAGASGLAARGRVLVKISGRNYRQVTILDGPQHGRSTAPNPKGAPVWKVVDKNGTRINGRPFVRPSRRAAPSLGKITAFDRA